MYAHAPLSHFRPSLSIASLSRSGRARRRDLVIGGALLDAAVVRRPGRRHGQPPQIDPPASFHTHCTYISNPALFSPSVPCSSRLRRRVLPSAGARTFVRCRPFGSPSPFSRALNSQGLCVFSLIAFDQAFNKELPSRNVFVPSSAYGRLSNYTTSALVMHLLCRICLDR